MNSLIILRYWRTVRFLKFSQILSRFKRIQNREVEPIRGEFDVAKLPEVVLFVHRPRSWISNTETLFLNERRSVDEGGDWNNETIPTLWLYNLHYFDGLLSADTPLSLKEEFIARWIADNPPAAGVGWEPYPTSLRIVNWIKWSLSCGHLSERAIESLALQARVLRRRLEYHLLGNHLFANAKALVFAGLFFEGHEADRWLAKGIRILNKEIPEQFLADGAHFELSTTYHALLTEDLLDIINMFRAYGRDIPEDWIAVAERALVWLNTMTRPDGLPPLFNDAAYGITPSRDDIVSYGERLSLSTPKLPKDGLSMLADSGYFRYEAEGYSLFGDVGQIGPDYIPGHAHCDMMNFELFAHGAPVIVDTGISTYEVGQRRLVERGTAAHNTVQIGDHEQSEIWAAFRVGRRARIIERNHGTDYVQATHDGYRSQGVLHTRRFEMAAGSANLTDLLQGPQAAEQEGVARFHFHPDIASTLEDGVVKAGPLTLSFEGAIAVELSSYDYAPEFNKRFPSMVAEVRFRERLNTVVGL